ncbi:hypothetical protein GGF43_005565, partial [Coemansia sp. RSA 2618]
AWITPENLEPYEENLAKHGSKAKNRKDPSFADALKQAQDPSIAEELIRRNATAATTSEEDEEEEGQGGDSKDEDEDVEMKSAEPESDQEPPRPKAGARGSKAKNGRPKKAAAGRKRMSLSSNSSGDDVAPETTPKRSRTAAKEEHTPTSGSPSGSRRDSDDGRSVAKESPRSASPSARQSPEQPDKSAAKEDAKSGRSSKVHQPAKNPSKTYQFLMQLRHKLQKTVIKGPTPEDLGPVNDVLRKLEEFDMTLDLIQETKLGKVMRIIANSERLKDPPEEEYDIKGRAARLAEKWRQLILKLREGSAEPTAPESPMGKSPESDSRRGDVRMNTADAAENTTPSGPADQAEGAAAAIALSDTATASASAAALDTPAESTTNGTATAPSEST